MDFSKTIFVSDLDGTLLTSDKKLNPIDKAAIERYQAAGGRFAAATGRPLHTVTDYIPAIGKFPMILCNGGVIYDACKEKVLYEVDLPESAKYIMTEVRKRFPDISPEIYAFSNRYYFHMNTVEKWHQHILGDISFKKISDPNEIDEPWNKMLFADEIETINELTDFVKRFEGCGVRFVRSFPKFLEVLPEGVSKGSALKKLIEICGCEGLTVCAAGDYDNDLEMLKLADISFCPQDSQDCVKEISTVVLNNTSDSGAIAEALKYLEQL